MNIDDILNGNDDYAKSLAAQVEEWKASHDAGNLTDDEFNELTTDLLDVDKINQSAMAEQEKIYLRQAIQVISEAYSILPV